MNSNDFETLTARLQSGGDLTAEQMRQVIGCFLRGEADEPSMRAVLVALADKGETTAELVGAAQALRDSMRVLSCQRQPVLDTCGTGGDGSQTFNISTAAALAVAATGVAVAKHGNRKITSSTGSADVLAELGIDLEAPVEVVQRCLDELGICFCFAPHFHPAMRHVGAVRRQIARPTIFNRLGPLANPARASRQVLGVGAADLQDRMANALQQLGTQRSLVVFGADGVDEISLTTTTRVLEVTPQSITEYCWSPADFGLTPSGREGLFADSPAASAACIRRVFAGEPGPCRDVVLLNAAAGVWIADAAPDLPQAVAQVAAAIDSGRAQQLVAQLAAASRASTH